MVLVTCLSCFFWSHFGSVFLPCAVMPALKAYVLDMLCSFACALHVLRKVCIGAVHVWLVC